MNTTALFLAAALLVPCLACRQQLTGAVDDAAMTRARDNQETPEQAAEHYYPRVIQNYFEGMDAIAVVYSGAQEGQADSPVPVYQLLDKNPELLESSSDPFSRVDPVETPNEILGRNTWMIWCGGNEFFWDDLAKNTYGFLDLLRVLDSRNRQKRFKDAGLINEPGMQQRSSPAEQEYGLYLDAPADPEHRAWRQRYLQNVFDSKSYRGSRKYPDYASESYDSENRDAPEESYDSKKKGRDYTGLDPYKLEIPPPEIYGLSSGVLGLRLFPNPDFDANARKNWDPDRYYKDPSYYNSPGLVRPFRVGMSCAFCHVSFHPLDPPLDVSEPHWENISGSIGAQYLRVRAVIGNLLTDDSFVYHILDSQPPGTIDTSLIATDNINNPNAMNAIFNLPQRLAISLKNPKEDLSPASASLPSLWRHPEQADGSTAASDYSRAGGPPPFSADVPSAEVRKLFANQSAEFEDSNSDPRRTPRILMDGADSFGAWGALSRVYLNIGSYGEQWNRLHRPIVGFQPQRAFSIADCEKHSVYWNATQLRVGPMRDYFLKITPPMPLLAARGAGGKAARTDDKATSSPRERARRIDTSQLSLGRKVFAENCIVCHSSVQPSEWHAEMEKAATQGEFWDHEPGRWLGDPKYMKWAKDQVEEEKFWRENFLSTDYRIPVNLVQTNSGRALATNAITGNMWEDFSSESYRHMPSIGGIDFFNPYKGPEGGKDQFTPRHKTAPGVPVGGGGPGFYRVPSLVSIWATAPLLHNNSLGLFNNNPSVDGRLDAFDDAIRKLLWPVRRLESSSYNNATPERLRRDHGLIWRTPKETHLTIGAAYVPQILANEVPPIMRFKQEHKWLGRIRPLWLPSAVLLGLAFIVISVCRRNRFRVWLGYVPLVLSLLVGGALYFFNGRLGDVRIGPIPAGTPVNLLTNVNPDVEASELKRSLKKVVNSFAQIESKRLDDGENREAVNRVMREDVAPELLKINKCPDFVMDKGHYFRWFDNMSDEEKDALIELLKTF
jgi:mono/diheme cytochrome c family protein